MSHRHARFGLLALVIAPAVLGVAAVRGPAGGDGSVSVVQQSERIQVYRSPG
jgi:hypothetical protein